MTAVSIAMIASRCYNNKHSALLQTFMHASSLRPINPSTEVATTTSASNATFRMPRYQVKIIDK